MRILLTNDDGINAAGLWAMAGALSEMGDVAVVAPEAEMSAVGHSITLSDPLRVRKVSRNGTPAAGIAVNGTPADCVKIAVRAILESPPDMVVSGINHGQNVATNVIYSGTVSAATEGMILGIPSVAVSLAAFSPVDFTAAAEYGSLVVRAVRERGLPKSSLVSVNVPPLPLDEIRGVKVCRMGSSKFREVFEKRVDPRMHDYYWQGGRMDLDERDADADISWLQKGYVTVTPLHFDLTHYQALREMEKWDLRLE